ncbi:MAG: ADP-ribosylglycohydrolase family protein [Cytophagales bacterium]|nr:ADP-ribosylglycohydrolase family protein [Armatimonadota bacterium]
MLLELAVGDAYGAGFEYADTEFVERNNDGMAYRKHPRHETLPGQYTDDAQMSLAIAEAIVSGESWTPENLAGRFVTAFHRDPHVGYAQGFYHFLRGTRSGAEFVANIRPDSDKSGAAMRAAPIGVFASVHEVISRSTIQAKLTHDTPDGIAAANAAALMTHYCLYQIGPKAELGRFLEQHVPGYRWSEPYLGRVRSKGWMSVRAALTALVHCDRMSDLLRQCIAFTGDVDTVATIALAAGSCSSEVEPDLSTALMSGLENGDYGRDYIVSLDERLMRLKRQNIHAASPTP